MTNKHIVYTIGALCFSLACVQAFAAPESTEVMVTVQCVPTEAAKGFLNDSGASVVATDVFTGNVGLMVDSVWITPDRMFVLRTSKERGTTCVLTELPLKGEL